MHATQNVAFKNYPRDILCSQNHPYRIILHQMHSNVKSNQSNQSNTIASFFKFDLYENLFVNVLYFTHTGFQIWRSSKISWFFEVVQKEEEKYDKYEANFESAYLHDG